MERAVQEKDISSQRDNNYCDNTHIKRGSEKSEPLFYIKPICI